jgi:hypothetical protein
MRAGTETPVPWRKNFGNSGCGMMKKKKDRAPRLYLASGGNHG